MNTTVDEFVESLPKNVAINLLFAAMSEMQAYNGRSVTDCVVLAAGGKIHTTSGKDGFESSEYELPSRRAIIKEFGE